MATSDRRQFCRLAGLSAAALAAHAASADARQLAEPDRGNGAAVLVDVVACIGCRKCEWACDVENQLSDRPAATYDDQAVLAALRRPARDAFTVVNRVDDPERAGRSWYVKLQCMHCVQPACASACLVGAMRKTAAGPVVYDAWKCIGCRYCMVACPFQLPAYEYGEAVHPRVRKCVFCASRLAGGQVPRCVAICPNEALSFGSRRELVDAAHTRIRMSPQRYLDHVYGEHEVGGTSWLYLAPVDFLRAGLPELGDEAVPLRTERIQHGVFKSFVPPLVLYGLLGLIMHATRNDNDNGDDAGEHHERP